MPLPKDPEKLEAYKKKMSEIAKSRGYGKWMKGKKRSKESCEKASQTLKKVCNTEEYKEKLSKIAKENGHGKWMKGRILPHISESNLRRKGKTYEELYGDRAEEEKAKRREANRKRWEGVERKQRDKHNGDADYSEWREAVFERDDYTCRECGKKNTTLNAHHIKPWSEYPHLRDNIHNGITLCEDCHKKIERKKRVLSEDQVKLIRHEHKIGTSVKELRKILNVSRHVIYSVINRKCYQDVTD